MILNHLFELYFPSKCRCGNPLPEKLKKEIFEEVYTKMGTWFGGGSAIKVIDGDGFWYSQNRTVVLEDVKIIYSNANAQAFEDYKAAFRDYTKELANRLAQEAIGFRIDGIMETEPSTNSICAHQIEFAAVNAKDVETRLDPANRRLALLGALRRLNSCESPEDLIESARDLVCNIWHYSKSDESIPTEGWKQAERNLLDDVCPSKNLANQNGFRVQLFILKSEHFNAADERFIIEKVHQPELNWHGMFLFTTKTGEEWHFVNVKHQEPGNASSKLRLRRLRIKNGISLFRIVRALVHLDLTEIGLQMPAGIIQQAHDKAFDIQGLTREFFSEYRKVFTEVRQMIIGFSEGQEEQRNLFTQTLFNRLMFVAFIQKKGWLQISGSGEYLPALWSDYQANCKQDSNFYNERLKVLFFEGLNKPFNQRPSNADGIGNVPYLNGGLFAENEWDQGKENPILVPDLSIKKILFDLFANFDFTVSESTDLDQEIAIDPEMLGHVFEELVNGRKEKGSFYTPKPVVTYMARESIKNYLQQKAPKEGVKAISEFVENHDASALMNPIQVLDALRSVRVCDPACGSGAYLLGMLHELMELRTCIFAARSPNAATAYHQKLEIIQNNLYGVDIDNFAVNIARLRLWLSLVVEYNGETPEPMPNLDFKIEQGDSLTAPDPSKMLNENTQLGFRAEYVRQFEELQIELFTASYEMRAILLNQIEKIKEEIIKYSQIGTVPAGAFDWRIRFPQIFMGGGFDIILANPPYVKAGKFSIEKAALKEVYGDLSKTNSDLYVYFYFRALQLLKNRGVFVFISSNKWVQSNYGRMLRKELQEKAQIISIVDFGSLDVFDVAAYPMIISAQKGKSGGSTRYTRVKNLESPYPDIAKVVQDTSEELNPFAYSYEPWLLTDSKTLGHIQKMTSGRRTLGDYLNDHKIKIQSGIKTGCNEVFYLSQEQRDAFIAKDPRSSDLLVPLLQGKDILSWTVNHTGTWLLLTPDADDISKLNKPPIQIDQYPAIYEYLLTHEQKLRKRGDRGVEYWNLRSCDYYSTFYHPKIIYQEIAHEACFALDEAGLFVNNKVMMIPTGDLFLLGILNSSLAWEFFKVISSELRGEWAMMQTPVVSRLPIPDAGEDERARIIELVKCCMASAPEERSNIERELDLAVAKLYGISL